MSLFKKYATDKSAETSGILYEVTDLFQCRLARMGGTNGKYIQRFNELMKPYRKMDIEDVPKAKMEKITLQAFCETIIIPGTWKTWRANESGEGGEWMPGIENSKGELLPATAENYQLILSELTDLLDVLFKESRDADNYKLEALEAESKNS